MNNGIPPVEESEEADVASWYRNFLSAMIKHAPSSREIDKAQAEYWVKNPGKLKKALRTLVRNIKKQNFSPERRENVPIIRQRNEPDTSPRVLTTREKFTVWKEIEITIRKDYSHSSRLATFRRQHRENLHDLDESIRDENFPCVTHPLIPEQTYIVKFINVAEGRTATLQDGLEKVRELNGVLVGIHGLVAVLEYAAGELVPLEKAGQNAKDKWYVSPDREEKLPVIRRDRVLAFAHVLPDKAFSLRLSRSTDKFHETDCLLVFCPKEKPAKVSA